MRFPLAAMFFVIVGFIFFAIWAVSSYLINTVKDTMTPLASDLGSSSYSNLLTLLPTAFGIICVLFFVVGIVLFFVLDATAEEPEMYWRPR